MVDRLKPGMTPAQVRYVLGTPLITDTLNPKRWDYLYDYVPGTYARKAKVPAVDNRRLTVVFENGILATIEGADAMPPRDPIKPDSRDRRNRICQQAFRTNPQVRPISPKRSRSY